MSESKPVKPGFQSSGTGYAGKNARTGTRKVIWTRAAHKLRPDGYAAGAGLATAP